MSKVAQESVRFDRAADFYDATRGLPPAVSELASGLIADAGGLDSQSRVLEVGVGTGRMALPLSERVARVVGIDLSIPMMRRLIAKRLRERVSPVAADAVSLPFPDDCFDAALGVHIFHLIPGWRAALDELERVLRPGAPLLHANDAPIGEGPLARVFAETMREMRERWKGTEALGRATDVGLPRHRLGVFPQDEGWIPLDEARTHRFSYRLSPREQLERLEGRVGSFSWRWSDDQLAEAVALLRARLEDRFDDFDRRMDAPGVFRVRAFRAP